MAAPDRSGIARSASRVGALGPGHRLALIVALESALGWAYVACAPRAMPVSVLIPVVAVAAAAWQLRPTWQERRVVADALTRQADPGPAWREAVAQAARVVQGRRPVDFWAAPVVLVAVAAACLGVALARGQVAAALPAVPLLALTALVVLVARRTGVLADRWLAVHRPGVRDDG